MLNDGNLSPNILFTLKMHNCVKCADIFVLGNVFHLKNDKTTESRKKKKRKQRTKYHVNSLENHTRSIESEHKMSANINCHKLNDGGIAKKCIVIFTQGCNHGGR